MLIEFFFVAAIKVSYLVLFGFTFGRVIRETLNAVLRYVRKPTEENRSVRSLVIKHQVLAACLLIVVKVMTESTEAIENFPHHATLIGILFTIMIHRVVNIDTRIIRQRKLIKRERKRTRRTLNQEEGA